MLIRFNMIGIVIAFLLPAAASVLAGWWLWRRAADRFLPIWKGRLAFAGLIASTAGMFLESAFLIREYAYSNLVGPISELWLATAWVAALSWLVAAVAALFGKGRARWPLFLYVVTSLGGIYAFLNLIMD